jgi:glycerol kinase
MDAMVSLPRGVAETNDEKHNDWFIGSIDQGTTSSRFLIFNGDGNPVASHQIEFENLYPKSGYVCPVPSALIAPAPPSC